VSGTHELIESKHSVGCCCTELALLDHALCDCMPNRCTVDSACLQHYCTTDQGPVYVGELTLGFRRLVKTKLAVDAYCTDAVVIVPDSH